MCGNNGTRNFGDSGETLDLTIRRPAPGCANSKVKYQLAATQQSMPVAKTRWLWSAMLSGREPSVV